MPFAGYADFAACVAANGDKSDPKAYCGTLQAAAEKAASDDAAKKSHFTVAKTDDTQNLVFGWASVSKGADGQLLEDLQGDVIEPPELEKAAYDFVFHGGGANEMHEGRMKGRLVESLMLTDEKLSAMKLKRDGAPAAAWWVGVKLDPDAYGKVKSGQYKMFSIKGYSKAENA